jgi:pre-rRNA-processing protein TSR4
MIPPAQKDLQCGACSRPLRLLIQLYAPTDVEDMLRMIYIFLCKDGRCQKPGFSPAYLRLKFLLTFRFKVFRIQTPWSSIKIPQTCLICNLPGTVTSDSMNFCTQEHLERYQRSLKSIRMKGKYPPQDIAWKPMEIVSDEEPEDFNIDMTNIDLNSSRVEEDESTAGETYSKAIGDRTFQKFVRRIERAPEQILRYVP